jgi:hypothetical protein
MLAFLNVAAKFMYVFPVTISEMTDGNPNDHKESTSARIYNCSISPKEYSEEY